MDVDVELTRLLSRQAGVVSRRQVLLAGGDDDRIERNLRRRVWSRQHRGVFLDHTGEPTWDQRAWAAVLAHPDAALDGASACVRSGSEAPGPPPAAR